MRELFVTWQDPESRRWLPVGRLTFDGKVYRFVYTRGASLSENFIPFPRMRKLEAAYESNELFPMFANRLLAKSRPEYKNYLKWMSLHDDQSNDLLSMLGITGGMRKTDSLQMFPCPEQDLEGRYKVSFFCHGLSHLPQYIVEKVNSLHPGERLFLMLDVQNEADSLAVALRTDDPATIIGYCPRYFNKDFQKLLTACPPMDIKVIVKNVNRDAPIQLRLLCKLTSPWPAGFQPCGGELFQPIAARHEGATMKEAVTG